MKKEKFSLGKWQVVYTPEDGGRLDCLSFDGFDLLTSRPKEFRPPAQDYGIYEERPVYGYDDCFPSVEPCKFPDLDWEVPDHGEVCYLPFQVIPESDRLIFIVKSRVLPLQLKRELRFKENELIWNFEVSNSGTKTIPFQHVIHPLLPLTPIASLSMPEFQTAFDAMAGINMDLKNPADLAKFLLSQPEGSANMIFLQKIKNGHLRLEFLNGMSIEMSYPLSRFTSLGIWWNNSGYPDEDGCRRNECAFEPIPGLTSKLSDAYNTGTCLFVPANQSFNWHIKWRLQTG